MKLTADDIIAADQAWARLSPKERERWGERTGYWTVLDKHEAAFLAEYLNGLGRHA